MLATRGIKLHTHGHLHLAIAGYVGGLFHGKRALFPMHHRGLLALLLARALVASVVGAEPLSRPSLPGSQSASEFAEFLEIHCLACHDGETRTAGLALDGLGPAEPVGNPQAWEKVLRKLAAHQMPPQEMPRPDTAEYSQAVGYLESSLDAAAELRPHPGRTETFRRLNRTEYQNTIRDLLALEIDAEVLLPPDESSHGFDNITVVDLSPTLLKRYLAAAETISRLAVGRAATTSPREEVFRIRPDVTQDVHMEGLPLGTRGGSVFTHNFPQDGVYEIQIRLMRDRNENVEGLSETHELEVLVDRHPVKRFTIEAPEQGASDQTLDANLNVRITAKGGPHQVGAAFIAKSASLLETRRQPLNVHFNFYRHPRLGPAIYQIAVIGPLESMGPGDTPARRRLFTAQPTDADDEEACARMVLSHLLRRAYRRPVTDDDLKSPMDFYRQARQEGDFEAGVESALTAILVNPNFLFHIERDPPDVPPRTPYQISDVELASRLSYFLWSSMPDDELLDIAESGELRQPEVFEEQVRRMLADKRSSSLVTNFAAQWLHLRNLEAITPDMRLYPDFDDNLRQAMRTESERFIESVIQEDRSAVDLIRADYTFLNERLARHYGILHVYGSRFRRVSLDEDGRRGGLLGHGSILAVTSYATRTSPVIRGHWVLKNLLGDPPPPPPPDVPTLEDNTVSSELSLRERLSQHRADPACANCHDLMDPIGFALENFDAVGRWRETEGGAPIDASGGLPDGSEFAGPAGLKQALLERPELFVRTLTEKLLTFALGRGLEYYDAPAVRKIVRDAREEDYRFSQVILGIVKSRPFQMRMSP